jgi:DNA (cytosine-5)-methyltransferase 1
MKLRCADLFCGAGGTSTGLVEAAQDLSVRMDLTAVNHWPIAIDTHTANHPAARHLCARVDDINPRSLYKENQLDILWASPECTHHSIARGGKPINDQSRATAWCVTRWAEALRPKVILVENVKEFAQWGPVGVNGRPLKRKKGDIFKAWIKSLEAVGYRVEFRVLCAADYGDPTTRRRLFVYAVRSGAPIHWPSPTHSATAENGLCKWIAAREVIDWQDKGRSIFGRKKPLAEKTMRRIMIGLERFGLAPFILPQQRGGRPVHPIDDPISAITTKGASALCQPFLISTDHNGGNGKYSNSVDDPLTTATTKQRHAVCNPYLVKLRGTATACNVDQPSPAITAGGQHLGVCNPYLVRFNGEKREGEARVHQVDSPLPNVDTSNRYAIAQPYLVKYYGSGQSQSTELPLDTITTKPRFGLCQPVLEIEGERYIVDVLFRMLKPIELSKAQGFPDDYQFTGNTESIVKQIGNAVPKNLAKALGRSAIVSIKGDRL